MRARAAPRQWCISRPKARRGLTCCRAGEPVGGGTGRVGGSALDRRGCLKPDQYLIRCGEASCPSCGVRVCSMSRLWRGHGPRHGVRPNSGSSSPAVGRAPDVTVSVHTPESQEAVAELLHLGDQELFVVRFPRSQRRRNLGWWGGTSCRVTVNVTSICRIRGRVACAGAAPGGAAEGTRACAAHSGSRGRKGS